MKEWTPGSSSSVPINVGGDEAPPEEGSETPSDDDDVELPSSGGDDILPENLEGEDGVLFSTGNCTLYSSVSGCGAVMAPNGNVNLVGETSLSSGSEGVAIFGNNVSLASMEDIMSQTPDGRALSSRASSQYDGVIKKNGDKEMQPWSEMYWMMKKISISNTSSSEIGERNNAIQSYLTDKYGVNVEVVNTKYYLSPKKWDQYYIKMAFKDASGNVVGDPYVLHVGINNVRYFIANDLSTDSYKPKKNNYQKYERAQITVSKNALLVETGGVGDKCFGDQTITGVVYARNNININLTKKYRLNIEGALRAEKGEIKADCDSIDLTFNETSLDKIIPGNSQLTCELWNCW